jgi:membrane protein
MAFREKFDWQRLIKGALLLAAVAAAWKLEEPVEPAKGKRNEPRPAAGEANDDPADARAEARVSRPPPRPDFSRFATWKRLVLDTYDAMGEDRLVAVAAGVVFYALLAIFPTVTAFVSLYGLFADPATVQSHLSMLAGVLPSGGIDIVKEQVLRIASKPGSVSFGFIFGLALALWSANAGVKAVIDALNVIEDRHERRGFVRLNALSLAFTLGAIAFLLVAVGSVVAFPVAMSAFGLKDAVGIGLPLLRWPALFAVLLGALMVLYRFGPNRDKPRGRWFSPGAVFAALAWLAGSSALSFYLSNFANYNATYGSLGAAIGLMMWMWLSAIAVLMGAEIDAVLNRWHRGTGLGYLG